MAIPTTLPIRTQIRQAILFSLRNRMKVGGAAIRYSDAGNTEEYPDGFYNTMRAAYDPPRTYEQFDSYPCCNVFINSEFNETAAISQGEENQALNPLNFDLTIECFLNDSNDPAGAQDKVLADLQTLLGINYYIPDENGVSVAFNCLYLRSNTFGTNRTVPNIGIEVIFKVWYRIQLTNPRVSG